MQTNNATPGPYSGTSLPATTPASAEPDQADDGARPQAAEIAKLKDQLEDFRSVLKAVEPWEKKAQEYLDAGRWAGRTYAEGIMTELEERDSELAALKAELEQTRLGYSEMKRLFDKAQAELAALRTPIQSDAGISLGQVAFEAGNAVQKIKFPERDLETWEENAELHDMLEAAAQAVAAVVEARMIRRMEAVPVSEIWKTFRRDNSMNEVRARLIAAVKGEGQAQGEAALTAIDDDGNPAPASDEPSEPYHAEEVPEVEARKILGQHGPKGAPALCGPSAKPEPAQAQEVPPIIQGAGSVKPKDTRIEITEIPDKQPGHVGTLAYAPPPVVVNEPPQDEEQPDLSGESEKQPEEPAQAQQEPAQPWTPAVGQTVRLKSGGPVMTVRGHEETDCCYVVWFIHGQPHEECLPAACLTPAKEGQP